MIQQILATAWKDLKILFKDVGGLATLFFMPLMFILVMSTALQGLFDVGSDAQPVLLPVVNRDSGMYGTEIVAALEGIDARTSRAVGHGWRAPGGGLFPG